MLCTMVDSAWPCGLRAGSAAIGFQIKQMVAARGLQERRESQGMRSTSSSSICCRLLARESCSFWAWPSSAQPSRIGLQGCRYLNLLARITRTHRASSWCLLHGAPAQHSMHHIEVCRVRKPVFPNTQFQKGRKLLKSSQCAQSNV